MPLLHFQPYADIVTGILGMLGALWVICHCRHSIMRNIPGFIITAIALTDFVIALSWGVIEDSPLPGVKTQVIYRIVTDTIFYYFNGVYAFLCCYLAIVSLYIVRYQGSTAMLEKYKWWALLACILLPFPLIFGTLSLIIHQSVWDFVPTTCYNSYYVGPACNIDGTVILQFIMVALMSICTIFCSISYWMTFRSISKAKATPAVQLMTRLILAYLALTVILWITTISYFIATYIQMKMAQDGVGITLLYKIVTYLTVILDILNVCRGYFHALVVSFMYSRLQGSPLWKRILYPILLIAPLVTKDDLRKQSRRAKIKSTPSIESMTIESSTIKEVDQPVSSFGMQKSIVPLMPSFQRSFRKFSTFMSRPRFGMAESNPSVFP